MTPNYMTCWERHNCGDCKKINSGQEFKEWRGGAQRISTIQYGKVTVDTYHYIFVRTHRTV